MVCLHASKMMARFSDPFPVTNGVKKRLYTSLNHVQPNVFCHAHRCFSDGDNGVPISYHLDGKLFNLRRLQDKSKVQKEVLDEFLFADDMAIGAPTEEKMSKGVEQVSDSCDSYGLTIGI